MYAIIKLPPVIDVDVKLSDQFLYLTKSGLFGSINIWTASNRSEATYKIKQLDSNYDYFITLY